MALVGRTMSWFKLLSLVIRVSAIPTSITSSRLLDASGLKGSTAIDLGIFPAEAPDCLAILATQKPPPATIRAANASSHREVRAARHRFGRTESSALG